MAFRVSVVEADRQVTRPHGGNAQRLNRSEANIEDSFSRRTF
jgi:hypothetical protein